MLHRFLRYFSLISNVILFSDKEDQGNDGKVQHETDGPVSVGTVVVLPLQRRFRRWRTGADTVGAPL